MVAPLTSTASLHGPICISYMNAPPRQGPKLTSSSSQAFPSRTHSGRFRCFKDYSPNSSSSASLGTTSVHAHLEVHTIINPQTITPKKQQTYKIRVYNLLFIHSWGYTRLNVFVHRHRIPPQRWLGGNVH
jgi:hypothetical protein